MYLKLTRPLVLFDLETTGVNPYCDRIVEISILKVMPDGERITYTQRVNPGCIIPAEATAVHHLTNEMVSDMPKFEDIAPKIIERLSGCDIAGFNSDRFDLPLLIAELNRVGLKLDLSDVKKVDVQTIYHKREPRNLSAAYRYYCGRDLEGAHAAEADITATFEVLEGQLAMYGDLPRDIDGLAKYTERTPNQALKQKPANAVDPEGKLIRDADGDICFNFTQFRGKKVIEVFKTVSWAKDYYTKPDRDHSPEVKAAFKQIAEQVDKKTK